MWQDSENAARIRKTAPVFVHRIGLTAGAWCWACAASGGALSLSWHCWLMSPQASCTPPACRVRGGTTMPRTIWFVLFLMLLLPFATHANDELLKLQKDPSQWVMQRK